jgi:ABC-type branched-subunit amino acid transport system substrate-binding protein
LQGTAAAKYALDQGLKKIAIIHVNNDFGVNLEKEFETAYKKLGGTITSVTPYNEKQPSYTSEANAGMKDSPDALYLISYPVDGATIARAWISGGGPAKFLLNDGMNSTDFIKAVGAKYLNDAYGTSSGTTETDSTKYFNSNYEAFSGIKPDAPAADRSYDAGAIAALAIAKAGKADRAAIKAAIPQVVAADGAPIHAGKDEFAKALQLIKDGKPIRYEGVIGPISFDQYGDITGPFRLWKIKDGEVTTVGEMSVDEVNTIKASLK